MYKTKEELAKKAIDVFIHIRQILTVNRKEIPKEWLEHRACFVTLKLDGELCGCIGSVEAFEPLYLNIIRNAVCAAFDDPRFPPLEPHEFLDVTSEVSVLTKPQEYKPKSVNDLLEFLQKEKPGLIVEKDGKRALFLPQVWEELSDPKLFLSQLCLKAGLGQESWKGDGIKYQNFYV